jgi:Amt family ammonium transporter
MRGSNTALTVLGTFILWFGWYGFNPGSQILIHGSNAVIVARTAVTTTLCAAAGGTFTMFLKYAMTHTWDIVTTCNGVLGGLVAITAPCSTIQPWAAIVLGVFVAPVIVFGDLLLLKLKIDDVVGAVPVHFFCGALGVIWVGCMAYPIYIAEAYAGYSVAGFSEQRRFGIFYGGNGNLLLCQFIEVLVIFAWVSTIMGLYFIITKKLGLLRVPAQVELAGLDVSKHGGSAYHMEPTK